MTNMESNKVYKLTNNISGKYVNLYPEDKDIPPKFG